MDEADDDPTIICNMLEEFRANANTYYRSAMLPHVPANFSPISTRTKSFKSNFDNSGRSECEFAEKRIKLTSPKKNEVPKEVVSPWEIRRLKSEMIRSRAQIVEAEERLTKLQGLKLETEILYAKEKKTLEKALQRERLKVSELENRLEFIRKREVETIERCHQIQAAENNQKNQQMLSELQQENLTLKEQLFESNNTIESLKTKEKSEINQMRKDFEVLKSENDANLQLIESLRNELSAKSNDLRKLEMEQTKLLNVTKRVKDLESERETYHEMRLYVESQSKKLLQYSNLEKELAEAKEDIKRLKSSISNTMYLEEIVEDLKSRDKQRASIENEIVKLRTENQNQRKQLDDLFDLAKHFCASTDRNVNPLMTIRTRLDELIRKELSYISEIKNFELSCEYFKKKLAEKEDKISEYKKQCDEAKASCEAHISNAKRLKKQLTLVSWERNDLRNLLDSCQKEMTINSETHNQLDALQKVIDSYRQRIEQIESDPSLVVTGVIGKGQFNVAERDEVSKQEILLKEENRKLQEKIQQLSDEAEYRNLKGDFDPRQTKIIHYKANPTSEAVQNYVDKLTKANEELRRLQERIKVMEEGNDEDVTRIVEERMQTNGVKEVNELKERVKSLEIQNQRLCEVFKKKTHDFREAIYMMFGYRIDVLPSNQYRLRNQYAFDSEDILLFQISQADNSTMELLETPFSQTLSDFIELHLKQHQSIPVFLASVTIDLFTKQTISTNESTLCAD